MKQFIAGLIVGSLLLGGAAYFIYTDSKKNLDTINTKLSATQKPQQAKATADTFDYDANTLSAKLLNRQLEELAALQGKDFDRHYIMLLDTANNNLATVASEARKRASDSSVKETAEKTYTEANTNLSELIPLRSKFGLIHDD